MVYKYGVVLNLKPYYKTVIKRHNNNELVLEEENIFKSRKMIEVQDEFTLKMS